MLEQVDWEVWFHRPGMPPYDPKSVIHKRTYMYLHVYMYIDLMPVLMVLVFHWPIVGHVTVALTTPGTMTRSLPVKNKSSLINY